MSASIPPRGIARTALAAALCASSIGCSEELPTSVEVSLLPSEPITLSIEVPWAEFGSNLAVHAGFSSASQLQESIVARAYAAEGLDASTLIRFGAYPTSANVRDSGGTLRLDTNISYKGGYFVAFFDTDASNTPGPVSLELGALQTVWHHPSAKWTFAVDTVGTQQPWPEPGGGPVTVYETNVWNPAATDSAMFFLDSAEVAGWGDPTDLDSGARLSVLTDGTRLRLVGGVLRLTATSSLNPDTVLVITGQPVGVTTIYDVTAPPPVEGMRVGGAPAWRTTMDVTIPSTLDGPPELCEAVGCPFSLTPSHVNYAALRLRGRRPLDSFQPRDTIAIDVRPVLARDALPKSPLGSSLIGGGAGQQVPPGIFGAQEGSAIDIPITNYVRTYLSGPDESGRPPPATLALLAAPEPNSFSFAEFFGPGPNEPVLELIVTVSPPLEVR